MIQKNFNRIDMIFDFYELAQANGFFSNGIDETIAWFDLFFRPSNDIGGFCIMCGIQQLTEYIQNLSFSDDELKFLSSKGFNDDFVNYLRNFNFSCDIWAVPEGTPVFFNEPVVKVRGPVIQAQMLETVILMSVNQQSLIATKANRIVRSAAGREIIEFGARYAHGTGAAVNGSRSAYIAGCQATTNLLAAKQYDIPLFSSMNHTWVQMFDNEYEAFRSFAMQYPDNCILLIDTYDTMDKGLPNAIKVFNEILGPMGKRPKGVRINSGDLAYLSKKIRRTLNDAGYPDCDIIVSNSLDEYIIRDMLQNGARIDSFLVGEKLLNSNTATTMTGVYILSALEKNGEVIPKIKISENVSKITTPGPKLLWRLFDNETGKAIADVLTTENEDLSVCKEYELFDPDYTWKRKTVTDFVARQLLIPIFTSGKKVYSFPTAENTRNYCAEQIDTLWEEVLRFEYPHNYYVDLSHKLWTKKQTMIDKYFA